MTAHLLAFDLPPYVWAPFAVILAAAIAAVGGFFTAGRVKPTDTSDLVRKDAAYLSEQVTLARAAEASARAGEAEIWRQNQELRRLNEQLLLHGTHVSEALEATKTAMVQAAQATGASNVPFAAP